MVVIVSIESFSSKMRWVIHLQKFFPQHSIIHYLEKLVFFRKLIILPSFTQKFQLFQGTLWTDYRYYYTKSNKKKSYTIFIIKIVAFPDQTQSASKFNFQILDFSHPIYLALFINPSRYVLRYILLMFWLYIVQRLSPIPYIALWTKIDQQSGPPQWLFEYTYLTGENWKKRLFLEPIFVHYGSEPRNGVANQVYQKQSKNSVHVYIFFPCIAII